MKVKFRLWMKFTLIFAGFMILLTVVDVYFMYKSYCKIYNDQYIDYAETVASLVEGSVDAEALREYAITKCDDEIYGLFMEDIKRIQKKVGFYYLYIVVIENNEKGIYFFDLKLVDGEIYEYHKLGDECSLQEKFPNLDKVLVSKSSNKEFDRVQDDEGDWLDSVYVPILDAEGENVAAFIGVDFKRETRLVQIVVTLLINSFIITIIMGIGFCFLLGILKFLVLKPIYRLKEQADEVTAGHFGSEVKVKGNDEISEILRVFNQMSKSIAGNMEEMRTINEAYYRYIPSKILTLLGKESILDIHLGNEISTPLCVFSFQLADFERNIRRKSTREMIDAINLTLEIGISVVSEHEGMVENIQNAGFTALYERNCEAALLSAVCISQKLNQMVDAGQIAKNRAGIGIACGEVTLGIVGHEKRLAAITVSPYKDTACWLQEIAERYHAHILITQEAADGIPQFFESYHTRSLGFLYNTFTGYSVRIYDVYDGDRREIFDKKERTKELFEKGVELYCLKKFTEARQKFIAVLKVFRKDRAAKEYLYLCDRNCTKKNQNQTDIYFTRME